VFERISRGLTLVGQCGAVLKEDPSLLLLPLMSGIVLLILLGSFALPAFTHYHTVDPAVVKTTATHTGRAMFYVGAYTFYALSYTVMMFFNSALISVALKRLDGEPATIREGLRTALDNLPAIIGYALVAALVGTILRAIEERVGIVGRIVVAIMGAGWTLATALTLPVLIVEGVGPIEAISRSIDLLQRTWGENIVGNGGISVGIAVLAMPVLVLATWAISAGTAGSRLAGIMLFALAAVTLGLVSTTLHAIYTAALYRFATGAKEHAGIDPDLLSVAFRPK
jgi:predicted membrane channel-forming protein YqfA (hemolysin III family)